MRYPTLSPIPKSYTTIERFGGYRHDENAEDGEFFTMENLTGDHFPKLAPRESRKTIACLPKNTVLLAKDTLCYLEKSGVNVGGVYIDLALTPYHSAKLVSMGAYLILLTRDEHGNDLDKKWLNCADLSNFGNIEAHFQSLEPVTVELCRADGQAYPDPYVGAEKPLSPAPGDLWLDTSGEESVLRRFSALDDWVTDFSSCVRVCSIGIGRPFAVGDGVTLSGFQGDLLAPLAGNRVIRALDEDFIVIDGSVNKRYLLTDSIKVTRRMPKMDHITECGNRLWGCRYGTSSEGNFVNEIYCSKLGDFKNWECFEGISTDSYRASVGSHGAFTAAVTFQGLPHFFKENSLHKVYGNFPHNFQLWESALPGVQKGCQNSAVTVNDVLCYKAKDGIFAYDGALPVLISKPLGKGSFHSAAAGALGDKYYVSMREKKGSSHLFVYDFHTSLWHREDDTEVSSFAPLDGKMYFLDKKTGNLQVMAEGDECVNWMAQSGNIGALDPQKRSLSKITLRLKLPVGSVLSVFIRYDESGVFQHLGTFYGSSNTAFYLPIIPRRCDHFSLKLTGKGDFRLYSLTKVMERRG